MFQVSWCLEGCSVSLGRAVLALAEGVPGNVRSVVIRRVACLLGMRLEAQLRLAGALDRKVPVDAVHRH